MKTFKTPKGTELPIMDIKGKDYLQAAPRIVWFREEKPEWGIETEFLSLSESHAICRATIRNEQGRIMAQATSMETKQGFESFVEKAETCAVSRAASFCNFGTLMAQELEEQGKLAEAPQDGRKSGPKAVSDEPGSYVVQVGSHKGKRLSEIDQLSGWVGFHSQNKNLSGPMLEAVQEAKKYLAFLDSSQSKAK